jgi:hypothetical protein
MARQELSSPFQSFLMGRQARQQEDYARTRNALADMELADAPAQMQRRNALADAQLQGAQVGVQSAQQQLSADQAKFAYAKLKQAAESGNPKAFITQQIPDLAAKLQQQGIDLNSMDDQSVAQLTENLARKYAGEAGIAPAVKLETLQTNGGGVLQRDPTTGALKQVVAPQKPDHFAETQVAADRRAAEARAHAERMAQEQRQFAAEQNDLNRTSKADLKSETERVKERVLAKQNQRAYDVYSTGIGGLVQGLKNTSTGPLAGRLPAITANQQIADGAVAAMAPVLKQLFRTAGEGTFTDSDQALLMQMLPTRKDEPEARAAKVKNIDAIVRAKLGMPSQDAGGVSQQPVQKGEVRVNSPQEALALPPGTVFITPDGRRKVR